MERDRKPAVMFWTPAPASSLSPNSSEEPSEEEEQAYFHSQMDENGIIGLEHALDKIGLGTDCGDAGPGEDFYFLPPDACCDEVDRGHAVGLRAEEEATHTPTKCLNENRSQNISNLSPKKTTEHCSCDAQPASPRRVPSLPLLINPEKLAGNFAIMDEILPEIHFSDSFSDSNISPRSSPGSQKPIARTSHNSDAEKPTLYNCSVVSKIPVKLSPTRKRQPSPEDVRLSTTSLHKDGSGSFKSRCQTKLSSNRGGRKTNAAQLAVFSSGAMGVLMPDFSKVEPRVRFPKDGYTPPKRRCSLKSASLSPEHALMFKSPADIVKEVLLEHPNAPEPTQDSTPVPAPMSIIPPEFRSRQQATALMDELQEDNYRLKIRCAEAENTIDRLRLEGKVNLYSDPPKPSLILHSGLRAEASKQMTLEIPQTQRADISSSCPQTEAKSPQYSTAKPFSMMPVSQQRRSASSTSTSSSCSYFADKLYKQAQIFLQTVETFEAVLQSGKLQTVEQMKVVSELIQSQDCLEKNYLLAKEEHGRQKRQCTEIGSFDPERELESLVFQCGLQMDELKEQVLQDQPAQQALHSPPLQSSPFSVHFGEESQLCPPPVALSGAQSAELAVKIITSDSEEDEDLTLKSTFLKPQNHEIGHDEPDFTQLYQSHKVLPKLLVRELIEDVSLDPSSVTNPENEYEEGRRYSLANTQEVYVSPNRKADPSPAPSIQFGSSVRSYHPHTLPSQPPSNRMSEVGQSNSSSLSSLRDAPDKDNKPSSERRRGFSKDGVVSPETDSGFMGSEGSHLTPAAAASPVHQGKLPGLTGNPCINPCHMPTLGRLKNEGLTVRPQQTKRSRKGERKRPSSASHSQGPRASCTQRTADSESSESRLNHHTPSSPEDGQSDHFNGSIISPRGSSAYRHGLLRVQNASRGATYDEALHLLQAEVVRLKDNMETFVENRVRAERSHPITSTPVFRSDRQKPSHRGRQERRKNDEGIQVELKRSVSNKISQTDCRLETQPFPQQDSRFTQTSDAECHRSHLAHRRAHFIHNFERAEGADHQQTRAPVCAECFSREKCKHENIKEKASNHSCHAHHCGPAQSDSFSHRGTQTVSTSGAADRSTHSDIQGVPLCSPHLLLYSYPVPIHLPPTKSEGHPKVRGHREMKSRHPVPAERDSSMGKSLDKALRAARSMKLTSRHMAHTLASGLQYQQTLTYTQ